MAVTSIARTSAQVPARRGPSPIVSKLKTQLESTRSSMARYRREIRESAVPSALMEGGVTLVGAASLGVVEELIGAESIGGVPLAAAGALVAGTAGVTLGQPLLIHFAAGWAAPWVYMQASGLASEYLTK